MLRSASLIRSRPNSKNCDSDVYWNGMSSPSIHAMGAAAALWWACQFPAGLGEEVPAVHRHGVAPHDRPHAGALDHEAERVLGVAVLRGVLAGEEVLDRGPQRGRGERAPAERRVGEGDGPPLASPPDRHELPRLLGQMPQGAPAPEVGRRA